MKDDSTKKTLGYIASNMVESQKEAFDELLQHADQEFTVDIFSVIRARTPLVYLTCKEEKRMLQYFSQFKQAKATELFVWDIHRGLRDLAAPDKAMSLSQSGDEEDIEILDEETVLDFIIQKAEKENHMKTKTGGSIFLLLDYHRYLGDEDCAPILERKLKNIFLSNSKITVFLVGPRYVATEALEDYVKLLDFPYPTEKEISREINKIADGIVSKIPTIKKDLKPKMEDIIKSCRGMPMQDVSAALSQSLVRKRNFDIKTIIQTKKQAIQKGGLLEFINPSVNFSDVGGLGPLTDWFKNRKIAMSDEAIEKNVDTVRGALLVGVPGCGKSLIAKAVAAEYGFPCLKLDFGALFGSLVGESENNLRLVIKLAESIAPCILWCDELEKGTSGSSSSGTTDGGTTARVMQTLLTWMQEKDSPVFIVGTANNHGAIAPELLRRFDEIWFVDNPSSIGREQIFQIQLKSRGIDFSNLDLGKLVIDTDGYNGDEIRRIVNEALIDSISLKTPVTMELLEKQIKALVPLSAKKSDEIKIIRDWAKQNCRIANTKDQVKNILADQKDYSTIET